MIYRAIKQLTNKIINNKMCRNCVKIDNLITYEGFYDLTTETNFIKSELLRHKMRII